MPRLAAAALRKPRTVANSSGSSQQEGVVALVGLDLDEADVGGHRVQRLHDLAALARSGTASRW